MSTLRLYPIHFADANEFVRLHHRHHPKVVGYRFCVGVMNAHRRLVGVAICSRPVARHLDDEKIIEVTRLCTDGTKNACSKLYSACARIAENMGYEQIITYILETESGHSLKVSGWTIDGETPGKPWVRTKYGEQHYGTNLHVLGKKIRWRKDLKPK